MSRTYSIPDMGEPELDSQSPKFIQRGKVMIVRHQYLEAVKICRLGLLAHPTYVEGRLVLGMALMALSRYDEVLSEMRVAMELAPNNPMAYLLKGEALFFKQEYDQALETLLLAKDLDPRNEKVRKILDELVDLVEFDQHSPRQKTETKVYPAQQSQETALGDVPSDVLDYGSFTESSDVLDTRGPFSEEPSDVLGDMRQDLSEVLGEALGQDASGVHGDSAQYREPAIGQIPSGVLGDSALGRDPSFAHGDVAYRQTPSDVAPRPAPPNVYGDAAYQEDPSDVLGDSAFRQDPSEVLGPESFREMATHVGEDEEEETAADSEPPPGIVAEFGEPEHYHEDIEYTTAPFLPPVVNKKSSGAGSEWSASAQGGTEDRELGTVRDERTVEQDSSVELNRSVSVFEPSVIVRGDTVESRDPVEAYGVDDDEEDTGTTESLLLNPDQENPWGKEDTGSGQDVPGSNISAPAPGAISMYDSDILDEEPTLVPGENRQNQAAPLGEVGTYSLQQSTGEPLRHSSTAIPGGGEASIRDPNDATLDLEARGSDPAGPGGSDEDLEDEETQVNVSAAPPQEALFGDLKSGLSGVDREKSWDQPPMNPRNMTDETQALPVEQRRGGPSLDPPAAEEVGYVSGVEDVSQVDDMSAPRVARPDVSFRDVYSEDVEEVYDESGTHELDLEDLELTSDVSVLPEREESEEIEEISVEMLPDEAALSIPAASALQMPPVPEDARESSTYDASVIDAEQETDHLGERPGSPFDGVDHPMPDDMDSGRFGGSPFDVSDLEPTGAAEARDLPPNDPIHRGLGYDRLNSDVIRPDIDDLAHGMPGPDYDLPGPGDLGHEHQPLDQSPGQDFPIPGELGYEPPGADGPGNDLPSPEDLGYDGLANDVPEFGDQGFDPTPGFDPRDDEPPRNLNLRMRDALPPEEFQSLPGHISIPGEEGQVEEITEDSSATRVKFEMPAGGADPPGRLDFDPGAVRQGQAMPQGAGAQDDSFVMALEAPEESDDHHLGDGMIARTAAIEDADAGASPFVSVSELQQESTMETSPGGPVGIRASKRSGEFGDGMLAQMTGDSGLFNHRANTQPRSQRSFNTPAPSDRTATSWITILVGEPGSHRWIYLLLGALGVLALAVAVGLAVRYYRLGEQIDAKRLQAVARLRAGNLADFMAASQSYADILGRRSDDEEARWMQVRIQAAIPFEFGDPNPRPTQLKGKGECAEQAVAEVYSSLHKGELEQAATQALAARKLYAESAVVHYLVGRISLLEGNASRAERALQKAVSLDPKDTLILRSLAECLAAQGKNDEALKIYDRALALNADHVTSILGKARVLVASHQKLKEAELNAIVMGDRKNMAASRGQQGWAYLVLARLCLNRGQFAQSRDYIRKAKSKMPARDAPFLDELASVLIASFQLGEAEKNIHESKKVMKGRPHPYYLMAKIHFLHGRPTEALRELNQAKGMQYVASNLLRAQIYIKLGRLREANEEVDRALGMAEEMLDALVAKAKVLAALGQTESAEKRLGALLKKHPHNSRLLTAYGDVYLRMKKRELAQKKFLAAIKNDPHAFEAHLKLADLYMGQGKYDSARDLLSEASKKNFGNIKILLKLSRLELEVGELTEASTYCELARKRAPNDPTIRLKVAEIFTTQRLFDKARKELEAAKSLQAPAGDYNLARGRLELARGDSGKVAESFLTKVTALKAQNLEAWRLLIKARVGDLPAAKDTIRQMRARFPANQNDLLFVEGQVALVEGKHHTAKRKLQQAVDALRAAPLPPNRESELRVLLGRVYQDRGKPRDAVRHYRQAIQACKKCPDAYYQLGLGLDELSDVSGAIASLKKSLHLTGGRYREAHLDLAQIYERQENTAAAIKHYEKYLTFKPPKDLADSARDAIRNLKSGF